ncbi:MAG: hypothetical protein JWQ08_1670 [Deinococcus sp.]|nr:hypothetical protein [Deinococcus sp.]
MGVLGPCGRECGDETPGRTSERDLAMELIRLLSNGVAAQLFDQAGCCLLHWLRPPHTLAGQHPLNLAQAFG